MCTEGKQRGDAEKQGAREAEREPRGVIGASAVLGQRPCGGRAAAPGASALSWGVGAPQPEPLRGAEEPYIWNTPLSSLCFADMGEVTDGSRSRDLKKEKEM